MTSPLTLTHHCKFPPRAQASICNEFGTPDDEKRSRKSPRPPKENLTTGSSPVAAPHGSAWQTHAPAAHMQQPGNQPYYPSAGHPPAGGSPKPKATPSSHSYGEPPPTYQPSAKATSHNFAATEPPSHSSQQHSSAPPAHAHAGLSTQYSGGHSTAQTNAHPTSPVVTGHPSRPEVSVVEGKTASQQKREENRKKPKLQLQPDRHRLRDLILVREGGREGRMMVGWIDGWMDGWMGGWME